MVASTIGKLLATEQPTALLDIFFRKERASDYTARDSHLGKAMTETVEAADGECFLGKKLAELALCYVYCATDQAGGYLGAVLLTDFLTRPQYFAYVEPVRPTQIQRILYGPTLPEHISVDVITAKLL